MLFRKLSKRNSKIFLNKQWQFNVKTKIAIAFTNYSSYMSLWLQLYLQMLFNFIWMGLMVAKNMKITCLFVLTTVISHQIPVSFNALSRNLVINIILLFLQGKDLGENKLQTKLDSTILLNKNKISKKLFLNVMMIWLISLKKM